MKNNRQVKKRRKNDRTWAEAATLAIQMSPDKMLGIRPILQTIYHKKLKDIAMNKAAENVLTTMLNHHAQLPNCPFFRVKSRIGLYALKESWLKKHGEDVSGYHTNVYDDEEELNRISSSVGISPPPCDERVPGITDYAGRENHAYSIQGRAMPPEPAHRKQVKASTFSNTTFRRKNNNLYGTAASIGSSRRHSSPMNAAFEARLRSPIISRHAPTITRANSFTTRYSAMNSDNAASHSPKHTSTLDLETPSSILVNANMRALVNRETFSMLPASYRYKLTCILPECDQTLSTCNGNNKVMVPSDTALTNEFFTQAVQEWRERLTDGEFTRETQSRIVQEIAKERSKIDPWKEKFFEEYYGQKQVSHKRLRSRSQNLAAETGHQLRDLGMDAQLELFSHLRPELEERNASDNNLSDYELQISEDEELYEAPRTKKPQTSNNLHFRTLPVANSLKKMSYAERIARTKLANSKLARFRNNKISTTTLKNAIPGAKVSQMRMKEAISRKIQPAAASAMVMKPSRSLSAVARLANQNSLHLNGSVSSPYNARNSYNFNNSDNHTKEVLNVLKRSENAVSAIADHSYTSALWQQMPTNSSTNNNQTAKSTPASRSSTTLVLCPRGNLVNSTMANLQTDELLSRQRQTFTKTTESNVMPSSETLEKSMTVKSESGHQASHVRPAAHMISSSVTPTSSDTERVLSICARPLTPDSFVTGTSKAPASLLGNIIQVPSPLAFEAQVEPPTITSNMSSSSKLECKSEASHKIEEVLKDTKPLIQPAKMKQLTTTTPSLIAINTSNSQSTLSCKPVIKETPVQSTAEVSTSTPLIQSSTCATTLVMQVHPANTTPSSVVTCAVPILTQTRSLFDQFTPIVSRCQPTHTLIRPQTTSTSPLVPGRFSLAGTKRPLPITPPNFSPPTRWGGSSCSPSPVKKTRTLAEIKAQMKAKRAAAAAAANIRPALPIQPPGVVAANSRSHLFCATTFPVYFPMVTDANAKITINPAPTPLRPNAAAYIRLPTTATLPLEKVQWVSHKGVTLSQNTMPILQPLPSTATLPIQVMSSPMPSPVNSTLNVTTPPSKETKPLPVLNSLKSEPKGKITLKIKAAGSAISLKVDADVIKKEMKRSVQAPSSDEEEDFSSDESHSDDSDTGIMKPPKCHRGPIKLPKVVSRTRSSDSENDLEKLPKQRWSTKDLDTGQNNKNTSTNVTQTTECQTSVNAPTLLMKPPPVFGVSPFNVSVRTPASNTDSSNAALSSNNLFQTTTTSLSFRSVPVSSAWPSTATIAKSSYKGSVATTTMVPSTFQSKSSTKYSMTSKGKSLQNMKEMARTNMIHSDDSVDEDSSDDDLADSTVSTTTASENEKGTDSDDATPTITNKRQTRSAFKIADEQAKIKGQAATNNTTTEINSKVT